MTEHRKEADKTDNIARQAIDYLVQTDLNLKWSFSAADPPPEEVQRLLAPYFSDGEIELTTSSLVCDYLVSRLREDYLLMDERSPRPAVCRLVCGDEE